MVKRCIICGGRAGSREHIFPAALGGRRTNKGIYCETHNNGFSGLAGIVAEQLRAINAMLAIRPDHHEKAVPFKYTTPEGEEILIFNGEATPIFVTKDNKALQVRLELGGPDGLQAIAYIALTFFAQAFHEHAIKPGFQPLKSWLLGTGDNEFAWWESEETALRYPENPFEFGHTIAVTTSSGGQATAFVSLFGALNYAVALGVEEGMADRTVVTFIDPHADHPPNDIKAMTSDSVLVPLSKPDPLQAHLIKTVHEGVGHKLLTELFQKIERWKFRREMTEPLNRLNATRQMPAQERHKQIRKVVEGQVHRIYRLMRYIVSTFETDKKDTPAYPVVLQFLKALVKLDEDHTPNPIADVAVKSAVAEFYKFIVNELNNGDITMDRCFLLFSGGLGAAVVGKAMFELLIPEGFDQI